MITNSYFQIVLAIYRFYTYVFILKYISTRIYNQGSAIFFERNTDTNVLRPATCAERYVAEEGITITPISGDYKIKDKNGLTRTYSGDRLKRLTVIENEAGNRLTYDYTQDSKPTAMRVSCPTVRKVFSVDFYFKNSLNH